MHSKEFAGNRGKRQNFDPSSLPYKFGLIFMRIKQKKKFFLKKKKFKMADFSKWPFFKIANSRKYFTKISQIGPRVSKID
jgi:hypothetical protein